MKNNRNIQLKDKRQWESQRVKNDKEEKKNYAATIYAILTIKRNQNENKKQTNVWLKDIKPR